VLRCIHSTNPNTTRSVTEDGLYPLHMAIYRNQSKQLICELAKLDPHAIRVRMTLEVNKMVPVGSSALTMALVVIEVPFAGGEGVG